MALQPNWNVITAVLIWIAAMIGTYVYYEMYPLEAVGWWMLSGYVFQITMIVVLVFIGMELTAIRQKLKAKI